MDVCVCNVINFRCNRLQYERVWRRTQNAERFHIPFQSEQWGTVYTNAIPIYIPKPLRKQTHCYT